MRAFLTAIFLSALLTLLPGGASPGEKTELADAENGPLVTMELKDVELKDMLRAIGREHGVNIIVDEAVAGKITVSIKDLPLWDAVDSILKSRGYACRVVGNGLRLVSPLDSALRDEEGIIVKEFRLNYIRPTESLMETVRGLLSGRGRANAVENTLVVKDMALGVERVEGLLLGMDRAPRQVLIEARIVELASSDRRELGINWGGQNVYVSGDILGGLGQVETGFNVNLPSASEGGFTFGLGLVSDNVSVDLDLSALEETGKAKILSRPSILVMENREASIADGIDIIIPAVEAVTVVKTGDDSGGTASGAETFSARLGLTVTPRVINGDRVALALQTEREEFDFSREVQGYPPKSTRSARTDIIVKDGETLVMGGILMRNEAREESRVPFLWRIPLLGWLFSHESTEEEETELIIFLTPTIIKEEG
jgi:type IV pilus assembly protein PilQ